jgi:hypothetical protein
VKTQQSLLDFLRKKIGKEQVEELLEDFFLSQIARERKKEKHLAKPVKELWDSLKLK